ncbi:sodium:proton antiporter, partial [Patescibacteria group bacterium]|nr:sodium:proton antiporter [Patescibacteria group bacterium]
MGPIIIILIFIIGYLSITLEHPLKLDKTVPALIMAAIIWALLAIGFTAGWFNVIDSHDFIFDFSKGGEEALEGFENTLLHHLGKTAEILIFLI